ncbi:MAG: hypothetical protein PVG22_08910 [Chromatiales bacterium]
MESERFSIDADVDIVPNRYLDDFGCTYGKIPRYSPSLSPDLLPLASADDQNYGNVVIDEVTSIYDSDTFRVINKDWPPIIGNRINIRINGIDTPELSGKCHKEKELARKANQATVAAYYNICAS